MSSEQDQIKALKLLVKQLTKRAEASDKKAQKAHQEAVRAKRDAEHWQKLHDQQVGKNEKLLHENSMLRAVKTVYDELVRLLEDEFKGYLEKLGRRTDDPVIIEDAIRSLQAEFHKRLQGIRVPKNLIRRVLGKHSEKLGKALKPSKLPKKEQTPDKQSEAPSEQATGSADGSASESAPEQGDAQQQTSTASFETEAHKKKQSIKQHEKQNETVYGQLKEAAVDASQANPGDPVLNSSAAIANMATQFNSESQRPPSKGRSAIANREKAPALTAPPLKPEDKCPKCGQPWQPVSFKPLFLRTVEKIVFEMKNENVERQILWCPGCSKFRLNIANRVPVSVNNGTISCEAAISAGYLMVHGWPTTRLEEAVSESAMQLGSSTYLDNIYGYVRNGSGKFLLNAIMRSIYASTYGMFDETALDILQQMGKGNKEIEADAQSAYVLVSTNVPLSPFPFVVYERLDSRSAKSIHERMKHWTKLVAIGTDGYIAYDTVIDEMGRPIRRQICIIHWRRHLLEALGASSLQDLPYQKDGMATAVENFKNHDPYQLLCMVGIALRELYITESSLQRREGETDAALLERIASVRRGKETEIMDHIDVIMQELGRKYAKIGDNGRYVAVNKDAAYSEAIVFYMNARDNLREFLSDPILVPDTNLCEQSVRPLDVLRRVSGYRQSQQGADAVCAWFTLFETAEKCGIKDPQQWLIDYSHAFFKFCCERTLELRVQDGLPFTNITEFYPQAIEEFDMKEWLPWNYAKSKKNT